MNRENTPKGVLDFHTLLNREILAILVNMEKQDLTQPPPLRNGEQPLGQDAEGYCNYHKGKIYKINDSRILKRDIENIIQMGLREKFIAHNERNHTLPRQWASPKPNNTSSSHNKKETIDVIIRGFKAGGNTNNTREVYAI